MSLRKFLLQIPLRLLVKRKPLPDLPEGRDWWVIESLCHNREDNFRFRVFSGVIGHSKNEAIAHYKKSDDRLDAALMRSDIFHGRIADASEWQPVSTLIQHIAIHKVKTEFDIAVLDFLLLEMLREHEFFIDDFDNDVATAIGGGTFK